MAIWVAILVAFWGFTADDAYITARYGRNLAETGQFVFNAGERISAMTSPAEGLLAGALQLALGSAVAATKVLGAIAVLGAALAGAASLKRTPWAALVFLVIVLLSPFVGVWTVGGMETPFLLALITSMVLLATQPQGPIGVRRAALLSLLIGVAFLTRYDSILFTGPLLVWLVMRNRRSRTVLLLTLMPAAVLALGWLGFAQVYFGDLFPTPFYVKTPTLNAHTLKHSGIYELQFLVVSGAGLLLVPSLLSLASGGERRAAVLRALRARWWLAVGLMMIFAYGLSAGQVHMMFSFRLFIPYLPALTLLALGLLGASGATHSPKARRLRLAIGLLAVVALMQVVTTPLVYWRGLNPLGVGEYSHFSLRSYSVFTRELSDAADAIQRHWRRQSESGHRFPRVYTFAGGVVPYELPKSYTYELLVGYRHYCLYDWRTSADYSVALWPRNGPRGAWIRPSGHVSTIFSQTLYDGEQEHLEVFFQPHPAANRLPATVDGRCLPARRGG